MNTGTNFMNFENLNKLIEERKKEIHPYKNYEFDNTNYTLLLIDINNLLKENQELKKQLEETDRKLFFIKNELDMREKSIDDKLTQQKEFKNYLENEIYSIEPKGTSINYNCEYDSEEDCVMAMQEQSRLNTLKEILQKYKEIKEMINNGV